MIHPVGKRVRILFEGHKTHELPEIYPMETELDDVSDKIPWDKLESEFGDRLGWGLIEVYNTESGKPEPGDMFWRELSEGFKHYQWDNSDGRELHVICPNGEHWNIDGRASNCTMPKDKEHRCWVRTGEPPNITVGKGGHTCSAGAGSIHAGNYHGFLRNGEFT